MRYQLVINDFLFPLMRACRRSHAHLLHEAIAQSFPPETPSPSQPFAHISDVILYLSCSPQRISWRYREVRNQEDIAFQRRIIENDEALPREI